MKFKNVDGWNLVLKNNQDPYGGGIIRFAEKWADLMEEKIAEGFAVKDVAEECSRRADTEGITGFMYGCAVRVLSQVWEYGEELRVWHNIDSQIGSEGEKANESGGVLNPALINVQ